MLLYASVVSGALTSSWVHEQSAHRNTPCAMEPVHPPSPSALMGGPFPVQLTGPASLPASPTYVGTHARPAHPVPGPQTVEQPPQWSLSVPGSTHSLPHASSPAWHPASEGTHAFEEQSCCAVQVTPQPPQLPGSSPLVAMQTAVAQRLVDGARATAVHAQLPGAARRACVGGAIGWSDRVVIRAGVAEGQGVEGPTSKPPSD